jgi:hypothetical protein
VVGSAEASEPFLQTVRIEVTNAEGNALSGLTAYTTWLGKERSVELTDDGVAPDAFAADWVWAAEWSGRSVRMLPIRLVAKCVKDAKPAIQEVYAGLELLSGGDNVLSYALRNDCNAPAVRFPDQANPLEADHRLLAGHALWVVLGFFLVALAAFRRGPEPTSRDAGPLWPWIFVWLVLACGWTWPAVLAGPEVWVGRHFDLPGTIWSLSAIPRLDWHLVDDLTGWPRGADYSRFDSYTLIPIGHLLQSVHPARVHGWLQIGGVALSAWAAQGFARALGARAPWDMIAGLAFAFSGAASTVLLEGHVYVLLNPWMPLFGWAWWLAMTRRTTVWQGVLAGVFFCLVTLTTIYLGLTAAVIAIGFFIGGMVRHGREVLRPALAACALVVPMLAVLVWVTIAGDSGLHDMTNPWIQLGSANLLNVLGPVPQIDFDGHSIAPTISPVVLGLMLVAPIVMRDWQRYRTIWWTGVAALVLSFGISIDADVNSPLLRLPLFWVLDAFESRWYRFPVRMFWGWGLCAGVLGAVVLTRFAGGNRRLAALVLLGAVGHSFFAVRHADRQRFHLAEVPTAYLSVEGPVLDLFPEGSDLAGEEEMWFSALACGYQVEHGLPLAENCVSTVPQDNPRNVIGRVVRAQLLAGREALVREMLSSIGFAAIALHPDLFSAGDADRIRTALEVFGAPLADTTDGGEHIVMIPVSSSEHAEDLSKSERVAIFDAVAGSHFFTNYTIGAVLADLPGPQPPDRQVRIEIREAMTEMRNVDHWIGKVGWDGEELSLRFDDLYGAVGDDEAFHTRWVADPTKTLPRHFTLSVTGIGYEGEIQAEWSGDVYSRTADDRVVFAYGKKGLHPIVPTSAVNLPLQETGAGLLAAIFWGFFVFVATWVCIALRWHTRRAGGMEE